MWSGRNLISALQFPLISFLFHRIGFSIIAGLRLRKAASCLIWSSSPSSIPSHIICLFVVFQVIQLDPVRRWMDDTLHLLLLSLFSAPMVTNSLSHTTESWDHHVNDFNLMQEGEHTADLLPTSSLALHVDMPASLMAERVYQPASDFVNLSINRHWRPEPSWYRLWKNRESLMCLY